MWHEARHNAHKRGSSLYFPWGFLHNTRVSINILISAVCLNSWLLTLYCVEPWWCGPGVQEELHQWPETQAGGAGQVGRPGRGHTRQAWELGNRFLSKLTPLSPSFALPGHHMVLSSDPCHHLALRVSCGHRNQASCHHHAPHTRISVSFCKILFIKPPWACHKPDSRKNDIIMKLMRTRDSDHWQTSLSIIHIFHAPGPRPNWGIFSLIFPW